MRHDFLSYVLHSRILVIESNIYSFQDASFLFSLFFKTPTWLKIFFLWLILTFLKNHYPKNIFLFIPSKFQRLTHPFTFFYSPSTYLSFLHQSENLFFQVFILLLLFFVNGVLIIPSLWNGIRGKKNISLTWNDSDFILQNLEKLCFLKGYNYFLLTNKLWIRKTVIKCGSCLQLKL